MTTAETDFRPATAADLAGVRRLLASADLPFEDLHAQAMNRFLVLPGGGGELIATGGIERYGSDGLLRSVAVDMHARGAGLGTALAHALETHARQPGVTTLYLLTTTAANFFARLGYAPVERTAVPSQVAQSAEFAALCPANAACLKKTLE